MLSQNKILFYLWHAASILFTAAFLVMALRFISITGIEGKPYPVILLIPNIVDQTDYNFDWLITTAEQIRSLNLELQAAKKAKEDYQKMSGVSGSWDYSRSTKKQRETLGQLQKHEMDLRIRLMNLIHKYNFHNKPGNSILSTFEWDGTRAVESK